MANIECFNFKLNISSTKTLDRKYRNVVVRAGKSVCQGGEKWRLSGNINLKTVVLTWLVNDSQKDCVHSADRNKREGCPRETQHKRYPEHNMNHNSFIVKLILFGCTRPLTSLCPQITYMSLRLSKRNFAWKQTKFIPYCSQKHLFYANTYYILSTVFPL